MKATQENVTKFVSGQEILYWNDLEGNAWSAEFFLTADNQVKAILKVGGYFFNNFEIENCSFFIGEDECSVELQWADIYYEFVQTFKELGYAGK